MGCFLACFGYSKKRKHRKPANKVLFGDQTLNGSYQPLDSSVSIKLDITDNPISPDSGFREKPKERSSFKIRKKVSFNLNVQAYEPIPTDNFLESDEEKNGEKNEEETAKGIKCLSLSKGDSLALRIGSYPSNYRYQNCRDSYDEEDEIVLDEDDWDLDDDEDEDEDNDDDYNGDDGKINQQEFSEQFYSLSIESQKRASMMTQLAGDKIGLNQNARNRSQYVHSVLNPVENLTQWKAVKARAILPLKYQSKENNALEKEQEQPQMPFSSRPSFNPTSFNFAPNFHQSSKPPVLQEITVDASLSNWLDPSKSSSSIIAAASISSKKNIWNTLNSPTNTQDNTGLRGH